MPERRRRPTQVDIARRAGVSQATVSLVISGGTASEQIAEPTRQAVLAAAAELGYSANIAARSLKGGRNHLLGLYTFEPVFPTDQRDFYYPFLLGVEEESAAQGYDLLLFSSVTSAADRSIYGGGVNRLRLADGCVLLGRHVQRSDLAALVSEDFPFVFIGRREVDNGELSYVGADYVAATSAMVAELARLGHERILYLRGIDDSEPTRDREAGYRTGLAAAGIEVDETLVQAVTDPGELSAAHLRHWIGTYGVTAVLMEPTEDNRLVDALTAMTDRAGIRFPQDCSIALLGDPLTWAPGLRDWTRFSLPRAEMAREAVRMLVGLLGSDDPQPRQLVIPCQFIAGDSIGPAPGRGTIA